MQKKILRKEEKNNEIRLFLFEKHKNSIQITCVLKI